MSCRIGINNLVKSVIKDKPWFYFNERENYVEILDSPTNRISRYTAFGVAKSLAKDLNKVINNGYKQIGDVFYPNYMNRKRIVEINPSKKQLDLIKATDEKEVLEIEAEIKKEQLQKEFDFLNNEANISINYEGDVIPNIDNTVDDKKNITKQKNILYSIRTKSVEEIAKGLNTDLVRSEQQIKYSSYIKTMILTFMGDIGPGKKLKMSPDEAFQKSKEMFIKINNNIATALNTHIKSEEDFLKVKESTSYEEIIKIFPVLKYAKTYEDLQKAAKTYSDVIAKFDSYVTFVKIDLAHNGIRIVKNKIKNVDVEELAVKNEDESNDSSEISQNEIGERYGMDNFQTNPRDTASIRVKSLIQTIAIPDEYEFGVPIYANPNDVFADILEIGADIELSGFDSDKTKLTEFKKQLSDRAQSRTYLSNLLNKIESFEKNNEWERINDILTVASKAYAIETLLLYKTRKTGSQINGIYDAKIISTNRDSIDLQISKEWLFNHLQSDFYTKNSQKDLFPKQSKIDLLNQIIEEGANKENSIQVKKFQEFFNVLGIDFTENEVNIISKKLPKVLKKATFNAFFQKNNLLKNIVESFELNIKQPFEGQYGFKNESTSMKELAKIYYELNPGRYKIASTKTADNKSKYAYILPTYLEQVKREWDNGNTSSVMNGVLSKPNSQDQESFWNKVLRNQAKFKIDYFNGIREQKAGENGKVRKFLTPKEQIATMFLLHQQNLNVGSYIAFTLSDKTANMETVMTKEFFVNTSNSAVGVNIDYALADNKIVYTNALKNKIYNSFVEPEISRILASIKNKESVNIENYDIASKLFYFLPNLNRNSNLVNFRNDLYSGSFTIEELSTKYSDIVGQAVLNEIQTDTELEIDKLISIGVINVDKNNNYTYPLFINGNSESDYVNAFRKTNATGRNMARLMVMDMKLNYLNSQIKTIQYLKFDPALAFKTSIDVKDKTISNIADEDKVTIANTTWDEFSKRAAALVAPGSQGSWSWNIGEDLYKEASEDYITVTAKDVKVEVKNADGTLLNKSEITDAEEFVTMQEHIDYLMSQGKIPYETWLSIYNKIKKAGPGGYYKLTSEELTLTISPTKPVYVNYTKVGDEELGLNRIDYVKSSRYPLIPQQEAGSERDKLRVWMEKNNVRSVNFASAKKLGRPTKSLELFDKDNNFVEPSDDDFKSSMQLLSRDGIRNQQEIPEQKDKVSTVTQMNRTIFDGLLGVKNFNFGNMKNVTGSKGKELKEAVRARLFEIESENLKEKIGNLNVSHEKLYELLKDIIENDTTGSYTQNDLLALEIDPQTKKFKIPLEAQYKLKKFQSLINSLIDKNVMLKVDGSSFVQVSGVGNKYTFSNISKGIKSDIIWIDKYADDFAKDGATLKYIRQEDNKTKAAQVIVSQYLRDDEGNLIDLTDYITEDDFGRNILDTSKMDEKMFQLVGTRIPNQSHPSTLPIEVVGFLPSYMENSIIVPDGITGQMGSDFDVDKLYAYFSKFKYTKKSTIERLGADENEFEELVKAGKKIAKKAGEKADRKGRYNNFNKYLTQAVKEKYGDKEVPKFKIETPASIKQITYELNSINDVKNLDKDQLNQLYRDIHWEVLMNSATFDKITKAVDMPEVKEKVNLRNEQLKKYNLISDVKVNLPLDYMTSITRYIDNRSGKTGVSIFATLISAQADFQDKVIQLKRDEETNTPNPIEIKLSKNSETIYLEFIGKLGESTSFLNEKRSISENLNMMFSESVDNAKNQFLKEFNWTEKAMSPIGVLAMLTDNKGNAAPIDFMMDLTSQSSIITLFEMIEQKQDSFGQYDVDALSKSIVELQNKIIKKIDLKGYLPGDQTAESYFNRKNQNRNSILDAETLSETWMIGKAIQQKASNETLEKIAKDLKYGSVNEMMLTYYNVQFNALDMFARLENTGRELMTILGAVYPYTKGIGSNVFSTKQKLNQLNKLSSSLVFDNLDNIAGEVNKLSNGDIQIMPIGEIGSAIENSLIFAQNNIYKSLFPISSGNELESTVDIILDFLGLDKLNLSKDKYQSIYNTVFESIISYIYTNPSFELFEDVVAERNKLINGTTSIGYRIGELNKNPEFAKNGFLKNIEVDKDYKTNTYSISFKNPFGTESDDKEVTLGFYNLALNENNDIKQLAKDLALYPFATGDAGNLGRFIPVTYLNSDADFNKAMSNFENAFVKHLINPKSQDILIDQIVQNNPEIFSKSFSFTTTKTSYTDYQSPFKTALKKNINVDRLKDVNKFTFKIGDFPNDDKHKGIIQSLKIPLTDNEQQAISKIPSLAILKIDFKYPQYILIEDEIKSDIDFIYNEKVSYLYKRTSPIVTENGDATYERIEILGYKNISEFDFNNPNLVSAIEMNNVSRDENELNSQEGILQEEVVKPAMLAPTTSAQESTSNFVVKNNILEILNKSKYSFLASLLKENNTTLNWTKDNNVAGTYYLGKNKIEIGEHIKFSDNLEEVIAHEAIHAIIDWETTGTEKRKEMEEKIAPFIKEIKEYFFNSKEGQNEYIKNILTTFNQSLINKNGTFEEVITYAFTDKIFAEWLNSIPSKGVKNKSKTLWGKLKDIILEILSSVTEKTKLDELNDILDFIFKEEVKPGVETTEPVKTYQGKIESLQPNQIFVFGSNPQGRHGAGAAQQAKNKFGAVQLVGRGLKNQTYALVTKNLTAGFVEKETGIKYEKAGEKSLTPEQIESNIKELYNVALQNPDKEFLVAYSVDDKKNLNGYTDQDMANMFSAFPIPNNMVFEEGFSKLLQAESIIYKNGKNYLAVNGKIVGVQEIDENGNTYISPNVEESIEQPEIKVSTVDYKGKTFIIEGSEEEGDLKIFYQAQGGKGEEVKDVNLFNKVFVAHTADIHPEWVVTLTGIQNQPKYLVGNNSEVISLQNTDYGKVIQSKDVIQKVMSLYYDKSQIENLKIKPEEISMSTENVFDITKEDLPVEQKPVKKEKRINVPKGSNPNNNVIMETEDTVFLMNDGQQEAFNFIKGKVEELLNNKKRIDVNDLDNTVIFNDPLTNKFNGLFPVEMWNNMIGLAGRGGVGKTTVIKAIIAAIEVKNKYAQPSVMYLAPGHTAATVLQEAIGLDSEKANDGMVNTIQSHLRMRPDSNNIFNLISEYNYLKSAKFKPSFGQPNIIIIDEASMVSATMIKDMITRLKTDLRNGLISNMPVFIFMGDYRQLGPINEKQNQFVNKGPISSTLFLDNSKTKELTEVMRSDNELLHKIYDSIGDQIVSNMTKTKNKEELKNPSFSKYDQLTKKSTENMLIVSNQEGVIDDYVTYLANNNNPYGMFWIHYNKTDNSITKNLAAKIRKAYFDKIEQPILEEKYRLFSKHDYIEFTGGVEISTDDNFNYTITDDKIKNLIEKQKYNKIEDNVYKIGLGVIKPNARFKVLDIVNRKDNLSALLHPNLKSYLPKNIIVDVETSILYNRQDKIRALSKALDISVGPIIDGKFGRYSEGTKSQEGITIKNNKTGEILAKFDLPYGTFIDVEENLKMLNSTNATMPFVPSYIGSSHTAQGNSIKNVIVGDYNIKQAAANGRTHIDDVFSSMYVALTRTSGTVIIIKPAGADIVNNQEVFLGAITDDNQAQRMTSASEMPNKFEEIEIQEAEETIDFMDNVIQQIIMDSQKEVIEDTFGKDKNASSILNTVYKNTTPFYKEILKLVSKTGGIGNLKIVVDENMTDPGSYDLYNETITINPNLAFELNPGNANALYDVLIHELLHHVTAKIVNADKSTLTLEQRKWVISLENLFKFTQDKILNDPIHSENLRKTIEQVNKEGGFLSVKDKSMYYGLTNINEFISMLMSDADFRSFMNNVSYSGEKSLFERFIDIFVNILKSLGVTVKDDTVLKEGIGNIIGIIESRNEENAATNQTLKSIKTQTFVDGIVESEFEKIIKYLDIKTKCK
jgi:predicted SprT family Zn-dependent metalloprotease